MKLSLWLDLNLTLVSDKTEQHISQLSFTSNQEILCCDFSNNQAIAGMAQKLWFAQEPSSPAKIAGWPLGIDLQTMIKDFEMWFYL